MKRDLILYVGAFELPDRNAAAQRVRANATLLAALGYKVVLVGRNSDPRYPANQLRPARYDCIDHECWEMGQPSSKKDWLHYITSVSALSELIEREYPDRIHSIICYNFPAIAQLRLRGVARRAGARAMADVTEWYQTLQWTSPSAVVKNFDTWFRMRVVNPRMDALITTSPYLTQFYARWFDNIVELPTLIEHDPSDLNGLTATPDGQVKRLFYGGSILNKNALGRERGGLKERIDWVIELLDVVKQTGGGFCFHIYGMSRDDYLDLLPDHLPLLNRLGDSVCFHGWQPRQHLLDALRESDFSIFMRPAIRATRAGFPGKFSESISFGTPVITNALETIVPYMKVGENCEHIEYTDFEVAVARIRACLALPSAEVLRRKQVCRQSGQFNPLNYVDAAKILFPDKSGETQ